MIPSGKLYQWCRGWFVEQCADRGVKKDPAVLKDDRLLNWCPFQLVLCQLMLAPVQRACNLGARCEAFLFHLVPQHLQKPHASYLRQQHSVGNRCTGRGGRKCHSWVMDIKKKKTQKTKTKPTSSTLKWDLGLRVGGKSISQPQYKVWLPSTLIALILICDF